jgi:mRNA-degrading endonuclease YafQ of YafQ-DinJ toxin-antitoxin module
MNQIFGSGFKKKTEKLPKKIRLALAGRLRLFIHNPMDPILNNHKLHGERRHQRSINITGSYRLIFEQVDTETVRLIDIDTHTNLYGA